MVRYYSDDGVFEGSIEKVWKLIQAHSDTNVNHIHASFTSAKTREESPGVHLSEVQVRGPDGKTFPAKLRYRFAPPYTQTVEFVEGLFPGSWQTSTYVPDGPNRTRVITVGEFHLPGLDEASARKVVDGFFDMGFAEDSAYLRKMG
jgi:hypothetical protein